MSAKVSGEVRKDGKVLVITRIHVSYRLKLSPDKREIADRVHGFHIRYCPVARSISSSIEVSTELHVIH